MNREAMHRVRRAIILAAGTGTRLRPLTLETPKPLIPVNGVRMIDSIISALHKNGIFEMIVVVGYRKEAFLPLEAEVPGLKLIDNPWYERCNNISSLYAAREYLGDCMILDGDQVIRNPEILSPLFSRSGYAATWTDEDTGEWLLTVRDGIIQRCSRSGGKHGWQLYSISRWSEEDGARLRRHLETEFEERKNRQIYWDDVPLFCYPDEYLLGVHPIRKEDILEIDSLQELAAADPSYRRFLSTKEVDYEKEKS